MAQRIVLLLSLILFSVYNGICDEISSPIKLKLSLNKSIELALKNNLDIMIESYNPKMEEKDITKEKSDFDPSIFLDINKDKNVKPAGWVLAGATRSEIDNNNANIGIKQKLTIGGNYSLKFENNKYISNSSFQTLVPQYKSNFTLTFTQPLLKNFGRDINIAKIKIAKNNMDISLEEFKKRVIDIIYDVQKTYWELVYSIRDLKVKKKSLELAKDLLRRNKIQVEVGTLAPIEVIQAEAEVASREEGIIIAENRIKNIKDELIKKLNISEYPDMWSIDIIPTDSPEFLPKKINLGEALKKAFENRPDYMQAKKELDNKKISYKVAKNALLPIIDFYGSLGLNGLSGRAVPVKTVGGEIQFSPFGGSYGKNLDRLTSNNYYEWQVGINIEFPFGNREAKSEYAKRSIDVKKSLTNIKNVEQKIILDVRKAVREIGKNIKRVKATRIARELAEQRLKNEEKKFSVGMSTTHDILLYQRDLTEAESNENRALIDYNISLLNLERVKGTTLSLYNIELIERGE
jgi:outer membrane protein TolC